MKLLLIAVLALAILSGCAGSANHDVISDYEAGDPKLSCEELRLEKQKAQDVIDAVEKDRESIDGRDLTDGLLWFPLNLIAKSSNYKAATEAAGKRIARLEVIDDENGCNE